MIITKISEQAGNPERANIYVDEKFYAGVSKLIVLQLGLRVGQVLTGELVERLGALEGTNSVWDYALRSLSVASKSQKRMTTKLTEKFGKEAAEDTVAKLSEDGLINDELLASNIVAAQVRMETKSRMEISVMLATRGISKDVIKNALEVIDSEYEERAVRHLVEAKMRGSSREVSELKQKIGQYLARKGFSYPAIKKGLGELSRDVE